MFISCWKNVDSVTINYLETCLILLCSCNIVSNTFRLNFKSFIWSTIRCTNIVIIFIGCRRNSDFATTEYLRICLVLCCNGNFLGATFRLFEPGECTVIWAVGQTSPIYYRDLPGGKTSIKLYRLVLEAHVHEQLAQGCHLAVCWPGVKPMTLQSLVQHANHYTIKPHITN